MNLIDFWPAVAVSPALVAGRTFKPRNIDEPAFGLRYPLPIWVRSHPGDMTMRFNYRGQKPTKRVLVGETREEEAARLEKEIAAHPVTKCELGQSSPSSSRPGWSSKPLIPLSERLAAEEIAKKMMRKPKAKS